MPTTALAAVSDSLMTITVVIYSLAMLGYAAEFAFGRTERRELRAASPQVLAGTAVSSGAAAGSAPGGSGPSRVWAEPSAPGRPQPTAERSTTDADPGESTAPAGSSRLAAAIGRTAVVLTVTGWLAHLGAIAARGLAAHRLPWGNMYEFAAVLTFAAVTAYLVLLTRARVRYVGLFVLVPVVLGLGLAVTVLYTPAGPLVPALHSYWLAIHVTAATIAAGIFTVAAASAALYLTADRYQHRRLARKKIGLSGIAHRLPEKSVLDRLTHRLIVFAFPIWTFAVIAGAIWAEAAWGRYWGWDPKETWSFITWVMYAGYLHARTTAGWRGRRAAIVALVGFLAFVFNFFGVNMWISGLHSYAGL